ncbi:L-ascorbate metabolism protein UlaG (beta-lactamase superfamily) [Chitinophaga dinghuensis]|uniref:L-ascorbate metabolism protein UlaG (Beta-lactamase superfamily) n=1 Tax=Chitinophaga dinghuensis TaxID=1539050 RepID=A0A327VN13_9BACT|nr:MBL fold metallo-hydrolase [Chitinophaga dinghuensis]RAJ76483.1 L-ascorbate metabolism protein UlaG (beta-lactamase superfamily) [Chitinophaga dinghuensis]
MKKKYGQAPDAARKAYFNTLSNYRNGQFQNQIPTPALAEGKNMLKVLWEFLGKHPDTAPASPIPVIDTDLKQLKPEENVLVWFGHSSYFIQVDGRKLLIDPVFSGNASPIRGSVKAFPGSNRYQVEDLPAIDLLLITHDHWDHLDYKTIELLKGKVDNVVCGLGVAQHFEYWGWDKSKLIEKNWYDSIAPMEGFQVTLMPARHFSGRLLSRNISLWTSYVLQTPTKTLFLGGDSGYGPHFKEIGDRFGPIDLAILECGQYNENWPYIHSMPHEIIKEVQDLKAKNFIPVHSSKFKLAQHPWYEPLKQVTLLAEAAHLPITTPRIGEKVDLDHLGKVWGKWWEQL